MKNNKIKVGFSISEESVSTLNQLVELTGKNKSRLFEDALKILAKEEETTRFKLKQMDELGDKAKLSMKDMLEKYYKDESAELLKAV